MMSIPTPGARRLATLTAAGAPASLRRLVGKALRLFGSRLTAPGTTEGCRDAIHALGLSLIAQPAAQLIIGHRGGLAIGLVDKSHYRSTDHLDAKLSCPSCGRTWQLPGITRLETLDGAIAGHTCFGEAA